MEYFKLSLNIKEFKSRNFLIELVKKGIFDDLDESALESLILFFVQNIDHYLKKDVYIRSNCFVNDLKYTIKFLKLKYQNEIRRVDSDSNSIEVLFNNDDDYYASINDYAFYLHFTINKKIDCKIIIVL